MKLYLFLKYNLCPCAKEQHCKSALVGQITMDIKRVSELIPVTQRLSLVERMSKNGLREKRFV